MQADVLDVQITKTLRRHDARRALDLLAQYRAVAVAIPPRLLFAEASLAAARAEEPRALRALQDYFDVAPPGDPAYHDALRLYPAVRQRVDRIQAAHDEARRREVQRRVAGVAPAYRTLIADLLNAMIDIPGGRFRMGDLSGRGEPDERPAHWVTVPAFHMARYLVTFDQYETFTRATGRPAPSDSGWGRGQRPVVNVSWSDEQAFVAWLNRVSGQRFRLPTEAEWEYAARAGTNSDYPWGTTANPTLANGKPDPSPGAGATSTGRSTPVGYYPPNKWGLYDMVGNVWEWTADCYSDSYVGAPVDGSARQADGCERRAMRGGSWNDDATGLRVSNRDVDFPSNRFNVLGMRLAEDR